MKKFLVLLIFLMGLVFPWACSDNKTPSQPSGPIVGGGSTSTPTGTLTPLTPTFTPTLAVGANTYTPTPTPNGPAYVGEWGTISSPTGLYLSTGSPASLYVSENDGVNPNIEIFNPSVYTLPPYNNQPEAGANYMLAGSPPVTVLLKGPQGIAFTTYQSTNYFAVLDVTSSGVATIYAGFDTGFNNAPMTQSFWGNQNFQSPQGMTADYAGNLYVADTGNHYIEQFQVQGSPGSFWLHRWNGFNNGSKTVTFVQPWAVACDATGDVFVGDAGQVPSQVEEFSPGGVTFLGAFPTLPNCVIHGLAVDSAGNVYVADAGNHFVEEYSPAGSLLRYWGNPQGPRETYPFDPSCIVVTATNIFVGDAINSTVEVWGP